jgi:hypothetical protein
MAKYVLISGSRVGLPPLRGAMFPPGFPIQTTSGGDFGGDVDAGRERA